MTKIIYIILFILVMNMYSYTYAYWYEEPEVYETKNIKDMWWLTRKKKEQLINEQQIEIDKKIEENKNKDYKDKKIKWLYDINDITRFPKNKWEIIDEDKDGIGYKYYFDKNGYLVMDTITDDYIVVDEKGKELDYNFLPKKYFIENDTDKIIEEEINTKYNTRNKLLKKEASKVIIGEGVVLNKKEKIYDVSINKKVIDYVSSSNRFIKETKGTIYNEVRWKNCSSLKGNGGYVVFNNPKNNFNKITGYIAVQYNTFTDDNTICTLKVYDADKYDKYEIEHHLYDINEIYENGSFNNSDAIKFDFTFDRSISRLRFEIDTVGEYLNRTCYLKDIKYSFSKTAYADELMRKKEDEEEIEELKRLGIYVENFDSFDAIDEDGEIIYDDNEEHYNENNDDSIGGISYVSEEETKSYEDIVRDRKTGPAFDESLQNIKEVGPGIIEIN